MDTYQQTIAMSRYARFIPAEKRRESWEETVDRCVDYLRTKVENSDATEENKKLLLEQLG